MDIFGEVFLAYCCFGPSPILIVRLMPCGCCVCVCVCVCGGGGGVCFGESTQIYLFCFTLSLMDMPHLL